MTLALQRSIHETGVLPVLRKLPSRLRETHYHDAYELLSLLWSLGYCEHLIPEAEIAAGVKVALSDFDPDEGAA
jgi:hypothetical protein